ncbi:MAG: Phytoene dehydrogenase and related proteins, partial [uncultured Solirubrobacteraceae bacterium]
ARRRRDRRRPERVGGRQPAGRRGLGRPGPRGRGRAGRRRPHRGADAARLPPRPVLGLLSPRSRLAGAPRPRARVARTAVAAPPGDRRAPRHRRHRGAAVRRSRRDLRLARVLRRRRRRRLEAPVLLVAGGGPGVHLRAVQPVPAGPRGRTAAAGPRRRRGAPRLRALRPAARAPLRRRALPRSRRRPPAGRQRAARRRLAGGVRGRVVRDGPGRHGPGGRLPDPRGRRRLADLGAGAPARVARRARRMRRDGGRGAGAPQPRRGRAHRRRPRGGRHARRAGRRGSAAALHVAAGLRARAGAGAGQHGSLPVRQRHRQARLGAGRPHPVEQPRGGPGRHRPRHRGHGRLERPGGPAVERPDTRRPVPDPRPVRARRPVAPAARPRDGLGLHARAPVGVLRRGPGGAHRALGSRRGRALRGSDGGPGGEAGPGLPRPHTRPPRHGAAGSRERRPQPDQRGGQRRNGAAAPAAGLPPGAGSRPIRDADRAALSGLGLRPSGRRRPRRPGRQRGTRGAARARAPRPPR